MNRKKMIEKIEQKKELWDVVVIGGGATGMGTAVDAASRGYKVLLLEQHDFAKGTSSRSTKLIHGGVRYLQQGNITLVLEALHERGFLIANAPHLVHHQAFLVPSYDWWSGPFYGIGLKVYDIMAGRLGLGPSKRISLEETLQRIPTLEPRDLRGGIIYYDGQFDDSRLVISLGQTLADLGGTLLNYFPVNALLKQNGMIEGVVAVDSLTGREYVLKSKVVINAGGIFTDKIIKMDAPAARDLLVLSQGIHIVLDREFLPGETAIMVPHTEDGRVLFAIPWHNRVVLGTTDSEVPAPVLEPQAGEDEVDFLLEHAARYLTKDPTRKDIKSIFAGIRPLVNSGETTQTAEISRDHFLFVSESGLITITGGKWTTYRKMAEDTIDKAQVVGNLSEQPCKTRNLHIHGWQENGDKDNVLSCYGSDRVKLQSLIEDNVELGKKIHPALPYPMAVVPLAVQDEMALTLEDILCRRTRSILLDAQASLEAAPLVAKLMAAEMSLSEKWQQQQLDAYRKLCQNYLP
jgi:glycerol-3-phosphate dehydrogenase